MNNFRLASFIVTSCLACFFNTTYASQHDYNDAPISYRDNSQAATSNNEPATYQSSTYGRATSEQGPNGYASRENNDQSYGGHPTRDQSPYGRQRYGRPSYGRPGYGRPAYASNHFAQPQQTIRSEQASIEHNLIDAKNGVFILFTRSHGTPQMISDQGVVPEGLIPQAKMASYESTVKPRIFTTHTMPAAGINCILIRSQLSRPFADQPNRFVDETYYHNLINRHPKRILDMVISPERYSEFVKAGVPAAFYYYFPTGSQQAKYIAIFGTQVNAKSPTTPDRQAFYNRPKDLKNVNLLLSQVGLPSVQDLHHMQDMREVTAKEEKEIKDKQEQKDSDVQSDSNQKQMPVTQEQQTPTNMTAPNH